MSLEKENANSKGFSRETNIGQQKDRVMAPGQGAKKWEAYQSEGIASIGWNETGDLHNLGDKKAFAR